MSRRTVLTAVTGLVLVAGLSAPALAEPLLDGSDRTSVCLRLDPEDGRDGVCVWLPVGP